MDIKIAVAYHKPGTIITDNVFLPIQVGKSLSNNDLKIQGDDSRDNISSLNPFFCELTALYWIWKNINADYKGLCHYRRIFTLTRRPFKKSVYEVAKELRYKLYSLFKPSLRYWFVPEIHLKEKQFKSAADIFSSSIESLIKKDNVNIIVPSPCFFSPITMRDNCIFEIGNLQWNLLLQVIENKHPDFLDPFLKYTNANRFYYANLCIMDNETFNVYCVLLFDILNTLLDKLVNEGYLQSLDEKINSRRQGYIAECITHAFICYSMSKGKIIKEVNVAFLED